MCRHIRHPDIFITITCNVTNDVIASGCSVENCPHVTLNSPDIFARVFKLKLEEMYQDIDTLSTNVHSIVSAEILNETTYPNSYSISLVRN